MKFLLPFLVVCLMALTGCSVDYSPSCSSSSKEAAVPMEEQQVEMARQAWAVLSDASKKDQWPAATQTYNNAVRAIVDHLRCNRLRGTEIIAGKESAPYVIIKPDFVDGKWATLYTDVIPCDMIETDLYLKERVYVNGIGIPLAGLVKDNLGLVNNKVIKDSGSVHTITAILDFDEPVNGKPSLKVVPRLKQETIQTGRVSHSLAADFTAPIAMFWKRSAVQSFALLGMFNPSRAMTYKGFYFFEPYDPDKIPVLFTHGLMSSPATFADLTNRLLADPVIRQKYQFWYFGYPSGLSWVIPARDLREALDSIYREYDPQGKSANMNRMVMVGHSMGGLITRLNNSTKPWALVPYLIKNSTQVFDYDYEQAQQMFLVNENVTQKIKRNLVFQPNPHVKRLVFMATPHKGSDFANRWFGLLGQRIIRFPEQLLVELTRISTLSTNMLLLNPERIVQEFTSIGQLSPNSAPIKGVQHVYPREGVPAHSIIGDRGRNDTPHSSDGVVKYDSSHLTWTVSEKIVPSSHNVQDARETALEMDRILKEHLRSEGISPELPAGTVILPTIIQNNPVRYHFQSPVSRVFLPF